MHRHSQSNSPWSASSALLWSPMCMMRTEHSWTTPVSALTRRGTGAGRVLFTETNLCKLTGICNWWSRPECLDKSKRVRRFDANTLQAESGTSSALRGGL
jgi:hypothetical protein